MQYNHLVDTRSLYIHWPFCPYKCHFCPFVALAGQDRFMERYHNALTAEINTFAQQREQKLSLETIYMGGGTPSTYPNDLLLDMMCTLRNRFDISPSCEITMEINPGTVKKEQLAWWKHAGINRLSIGVQSLNDQVLKNLNRHQSSQEVFEVIENAHKEFTNISADMILGLPDVSAAEWKTMIQKMVTLPLTHMSVYFLTVHEDTPLYFKVKKNKITVPCDDGLVDLYNWTVDCLDKHGFDRYEVSSFARKGYESRHNSVYWQRKPYKGFGLGACSFDGTARFQNEKNLMNYMEDIENTKDITRFSEVLTHKQAYLERVMLGIRHVNGIAMQDLMRDISCDEQKLVQEKIVWLKNHGFVSESNDRLKLTSSGLSVEHTIALQLSL